MLFSFVYKEAVLLVLAFLILIIMNATVSSSNVSTDQVALLEIKSKITHDPQGVFKNWNQHSVPFCQWQGVICGRRHQRVVRLNLTSNGLGGSLSPYLGNLSFLRYILFDDNQLYGNIPPEIGRLFRLKALSLPYNSLVGEIPANVSSCLKLLYLDLSTNNLSGKIPVFSSLLMIKILALDTNKFTGGIPPFIGNLTSLEELYLSYCPLGGSIPDSFHQLNNLQKVGLGENDLVGVFPLFFFNLSMLGHLNCPENNLRGSLPTNLCSNQPYLRSLEIANNHFTGFLPSSISNCSELEIMDVGGNEFTGEIAVDFGKLHYLSDLLLSQNRFKSNGVDDMKFVDHLSNCSNLVALELSGIQLRGVLPNSLGNFSSKLNYLSLELNYISGSVPSSIVNLLGLTTLKLDLNHLTGVIPESIGKLHNLRELYLVDNAFSGNIPKSIGNLSFVTEVAFGKNKLQGVIPSTIGSCKNLIYLDLNQNNLTGSVPKEVFQLSSLTKLLDLSQNNLSGVLPQEIGSLKVLGQLDLSRNHLSGELPSSFSSCISLEYLNLAGNFLHGLMPEALSSLRGLVYVDLSRNNLSGHIPIFLQRMDLKHLDLSYNNFDGDVPGEGVFANISAISVIGNNRLCGGVPELHLSKCKTVKSKRRKLSVHVIVAISVSSSVAGLVLVSFVLYYSCKKRKRDQPSEPTSIESFERISYGRIFKATEGFSFANLIGTGSFASVYKGVIDENGLTVAIKVLNHQHQGALKSFIAECDALRHIRHRNLVKVITSCSSVDFQGNDFKALVYDFMPNGSLDGWLYSVNHMLDLAQRISIIRDVACALHYLHCRCGNVVVHCDLKPSNILLDADMVAHVGDFGLAKILSLEEISNADRSSSSLVRGTIGYAPPEYGLGNEVSTSGDMYSYGILLLEMLTGKKPVDPMFEEGVSLHSYSRTALANGFVLQIVHPMLLNESVNQNTLTSLVKIGVQCSFESPEDRMDIETTVRELFSITVATS